MKIFVFKICVNLYLYEVSMTRRGMLQDMSLTWWHLVVYVQRNLQNHCTLYFLLYIATPNDSKHWAKYILSVCSARLPEMIYCLSQVFVTTVTIVATQHFSHSPCAHVQNIMVVFVTWHIEHISHKYIQTWLIMHEKYSSFTALEFLACDGSIV